ncbi:MAG: type II toxin-antitoxin system VapC family toxin [Anaerolineae bacterium]|nr:type II toxin-antitoxin system VapC family toxin [Anaerolineae bacterium]
MPAVLLDTDTLSEVMKGYDLQVSQHAAAYLADHGRFTFSIITRYEILRGLKAKQALRQIEAFEERCRKSIVLPLSDEVILLAAEIYGDLHRSGQLISDADILIAATARVYELTLVTENQAHFQRIPGLSVESWRTP